MAKISPPRQPLSILDDPGRWAITDVLLLVYAVNNRQSFDELAALKEKDLNSKFNAGEELHAGRRRKRDMGSE